jgi:hypothetical protein
MKKQGGAGVPTSRWIGRRWIGRPSLARGSNSHGNTAERRRLVKRQGVAKFQRSAMQATSEKKIEPIPPQRDGSHAGL